MNSLSRRDQQITLRITYLFKLCI